MLNWSYILAKLKIYFLVLMKAIKVTKILTKDNHEALHLLVDDDQIIIKPADKGSGSSME